MKRIRRSIFIIPIVVVIVACNVDAPVSIQTATNSSLATLSPSSTMMASTTATVTPAPTLTPMPTLALDEKEVQILELIATNGGCNLPCWWGIMPGKTTFAEAQNFYRQFTPRQYLRVDGPDKQFANYPIFVSENISPRFRIDVYLDIADEIVKVISVDSIASAANFSIQKMLFDYGQPSEIWVFAYRSYLGGIPPADVLLFYPDQGILARYSTELTEINENKDSANICLDGSPSLTLWSPIEQVNFEQAQDYARLDYREYGRLLLPLDQATGLNLEEFYELRTEKQLCTTTTLSAWPDP